ncbi:LiaI-LiaF-like domain-containing protein [Pontibacillus marinus]|uniref:LiaI-LiaF-like transmembrane region domain-containing protein n=1 Tax=Pontibacillus marinus BH030004 = DSM 16465 TaxID=1385511 RepID=A0A0A5G7R9_9BACI|nr:DUF5668 domain-containing protein [Pontibacillus marinus]KGX88064.1 hypothetical protein N783_08930 [Pontibacillus marinus BH030004 = DSM 16465]
MKKQHTFTGILLIGIGAYFMLKELEIPIITNFYSWTTILMIIGVALLLHSYIANEYETIFIGAILLGLGVHFHGMQTYSFWLDHWGMYPLIIGIAFLLRYQKTKHGLFPGLILVIIALFAMFVSNKPEWFYWVTVFVNFIETFWPLILIAIGLYILLIKKK